MSAFDAMISSSSEDSALSSAPVKADSILKPSAGADRGGAVNTKSVGSSPLPNAATFCVEYRAGAFSNDLVLANLRGIAALVETSASGPLCPRRGCGAWSGKEAESAGGAGKGLSFRCFEGA